VIRNEYLWEDWIATNEWLGQEKGTVATFPLDAVRDFSQLKLPVTKELSDDSRQILCTFLQDEYRAYLQVLRNAVNIGPLHLSQSLNVARQNCASLAFTF
jgi:hypothetical protein